MPTISTTELANEIYAANLSMENSFTSEQLVDKINENRKMRGELKQVSKQSVDRILKELYLLFGVGKTANGYWKKGASPMGGTINFRSEIIERIISDANINATTFDIGKWIELGAEPTTHKAYICYPYRDNPLRRSMEVLVLLIHLYPKAKDNFAPATPHEMYWGVEEKIDRKTAMEKCAGLIAKCDFVLFCLKNGDAPSAGMKQDMEIAENLGIKTKKIEEILGYYPDVAGIMKKSGLSSSITGEAITCQELKTTS
jgi:hypothetical protein